MTKKQNQNRYNTHTHARTHTKPKLLNSIKKGLRRANNAYVGKDEVIGWIGDVSIRHVGQHEREEGPRSNG